MRVSSALSIAALCGHLACTHATAKGTLALSTIPVVVGSLLVPTCKPRQATAPDGTIVTCPAGVGLLALGAVVATVSIVILVRPDIADERVAEAARREDEAERARQTDEQRRLEADERARAQAERKKQIAGDLAREQAAAARAGDCATARELDQQLAALDRDAHAAAVARPEVAACLGESDDSKPAP